MPSMKAPLQTAGQLVRTSYGQIIGLAVAGAFAGLLFFAIGLLGGWPRFVVVGSLIGLGFAVALLVLGRSLVCWGPASSSPRSPCACWARRPSSW